MGAQWGGGDKRGGQIQQWEWIVAIVIVATMVVVGVVAMSNLAERHCDAVREANETNTPNPSDEEMERCGLTEP